MILSKEIKKYRHFLNLSQTEFGKKYGVSHGAVSYWESGESEPIARVIIDLIETKYNIKEAKYSLF